MKYQILEAGQLELCEQCEDVIEDGYGCLVLEQPDNDLYFCSEYCANEFRERED